MGLIVGSKACPSCRLKGRDKSGNHLMIFEDGGAYCKRCNYTEAGDPDRKPTDWDIDGSINYTPEQFAELKKEGKIHDEWTRSLAMRGMKMENRFAVMTKDEKQELTDLWAAEVSHFGTLPIRNLINRGLRGDILKLMNIRVGLDENRKTARHYYPRYRDTFIVGAKCRNLPKDFSMGNLGDLWWDNELFGEHVSRVAINKHGARYDTLLIVGGELDAAAAQQMLLDSRVGSKWEGVPFHVWSPMRGEAALDEILSRKKQIQKFKKVIFAMDNDKTGKEANDKLCRVFRKNAWLLQYPDGCKDANDCILQGAEKEFVDAWWNPVKPKGTGLRRASDLKEEAKEKVEWGLSFPWEHLNAITFGIRMHNMYTIGGGSGVGKTEVAKEIIYHLLEYHKTQVGVIFMEEKASYTLRVLAGKYINKKLHLPAITDPTDKDYDVSRDYTELQAAKAIDALSDHDLLCIADCDGDTHIDNIMDMIREMRAEGIKYIFIDNLTTITFDGDNDVKGIDEAMKAMGTYMQEEPVSIFLLSHLTRPHGSRTPHEEGGAVQQRDFRGSGSIAFWSTFMIGVERNTQGEDDEKLMTYLRCVKDRLTGVGTGQCLPIVGNMKTGRLLESHMHGKSSDSLGKEQTKQTKRKPKPKAEPIKPEQSEDDWDDSEEF